MRSVLVAIVAKRLDSRLERFDQIFDVLSGERTPGSFGEQPRARFRESVIPAPRPAAQPPR
jgi:hypothetical protein